MPSFVSTILTKVGQRLSVAWKGTAVALVSLLASPALRAQDPAVGRVSVESDFRFSMVGHSEFKERSDMGAADAIEFGTRDVLSFKVREGLLVRFGFELERYNFGVPSSAALPGKLQSASIVIGTDVQLGDAWILRLEVQPGFYGTTLREQSFDCPIVIGASYFVNSDLQLVAGLSIDPQRKYPVLPGVGFRYKYSTDWVLDFILPTPRIEYSVNKAVTLYAGGDVQGGSYRMTGDFGTSHGDARLNDSVVDYTQIRIGGGTSWKIGAAVTLEVEAGVVPVQEFNFHRADVNARSTGFPPYGGVMFKAAF